MTWAIVNTLAIWACALGALLCVGSITWLIGAQRRAHMATMSALEEMRDTYVQGLEELRETYMQWLTALTDEVDRLKQRVLDLETDAL